MRRQTDTEKYYALCSKYEELKRKYFDYIKVSVKEINGLKKELAEREEVLKLLRGENEK